MVLNGTSLSQKITVRTLNCQVRNCNPSLLKSWFVERARDIFSEKYNRNLSIFISYLPWMLILHHFGVNLSQSFCCDDGIIAYLNSIDVLCYALPLSSWCFLNQSYEFCLQNRCCFSIWIGWVWFLTLSFSLFHPLVLLSFTYLVMLLPFFFYYLLLWESFTFADVYIWRCHCTQGPQLKVLPYERSECPLVLIFSSWRS